MLSEAKAGDTQPGSGSAAFWWRLTDNLFRRLGWYLLPVLALTAIGFSQARGTLELYQSTATLSASSNPLVPEQEISGVAQRFFESPAAATSRIINERLLTDTFLLSVADEAGLATAIEEGLLDIEIVRASVWAAGSGDSILSIRAQWADPQTSYELVSATISAYQQFLGATVASDSVEAEGFYTDQMAKLVEERDQARAELDAFTSQLPPLDSGDDYPASVVIELERLGNQLVAAEAKINENQERIDAARLAMVQQTTEAGRSLTVIDQPKVPTAPESTVMEQITRVASYLMMGLVIAFAALVLVTVLDRTVASPADLLAIESVVLVATVPTVRLNAGGRQSARHRWRPRQRRSSGAGA